jgi:hypothetical protein
MDVLEGIKCTSGAGLMRCTETEGARKVVIWDGKIGKTLYDSSETTR